MGILYIVRHSTTEMNADKDNPHTDEKVRGWIDVPLNQEGIRTAQNTANILKNKNIIKIYSSDLKRASQTAEIISKKNLAPIALMPRLRSWNVGKLAGTEYNKGVEIMKAYAMKAPDRPMPGGESWNDFFERWKHIFVKLLIVAKKLPPEVAICVVTHARNIYCIEHILTMGRVPIKFKKVLHPGGIIEIDISKNVFRAISNQF
jgi:broad specificity phosphatase PhoE